MLPWPTSLPAINCDPPYTGIKGQMNTLTIHMNAWLAHVTYEYYISLWPHTLCSHKYAMNNVKITHLNTLSMAQKNRFNNSINMSFCLQQYRFKIFDWFTLSTSWSNWFLLSIDFCFAIDGFLLITRFGTTSSWTHVSLSSRLQTAPTKRRQIAKQSGVKNWTSRKWNPWAECREKRQRV